MSKVKYKDGKYTIEGSKSDIKQKDIHKEKMKSHTDDYYSVLKNIDKKINEISDDDPEAKEKEQRLRIRKAVIEKMTKAHEKKIK